MSQILTAFPGQQVTIWLETLSSDGYRMDGYELPTVTRIIFPSLVGASGYPQAMTRFDSGFYFYKFTLPTGAAAVGSYIVDISYINPDTSLPNETYVQVVVNAPYGQYSVTTFT